MTDRTIIDKPTKFAPSGLKRGERIYVTYEGVTATATFVAGMQGANKKMVKLDGTDQTMIVPGWTITRELP